MDIRSLNKEELTAELLSMGEKKFRAGQIFRWLHRDLADSFAEMTNLSLALREKLSESFRWRCRRLSRC